MRALNREKLDDLEGAVSDNTIALTYSPCDLVTLLNRGMVYCQMEEHQKAIADLEHVAERTLDRSHKSKSAYLGADFIF